MTRLFVRNIGPLATIQDLGRTGVIAKGLSRGGAADPVAHIEGSALLNQSTDNASLEMAGFGGTFEAQGTVYIALTGAPMSASIDGRPIKWNSSHKLNDGETLSIGSALSGTYGYLHVGGGFQTPCFLGSRSAHLTAGIGKRVETGENLPVGSYNTEEFISSTLDSDRRFGGGTVRILPSVHTALFSEEERQRFTQTSFTRSINSNRQGAELVYDGEGFTTKSALSILSEPMFAGDIQMTGAGKPFVLLPECQTTGGYPRIGMVLPDDLPTVAQAPVGTELRFRFIDYEEAKQVHRPVDVLYKSLQSKVRPLLRDPNDIKDLLGYQLISGAITGWDTDNGG
ncbi:urea amidolyase [Halocynthiibacter sp. C4]|uniref:5-oxoprolinase subunit C family protein n=1 Tax=Halocynthiibacter sp. C4 TaxID=2992758 RepID=UPI00237A3518|nr:urea amidolyase [Halocynthiibacter sp. C4]MDE0588849.1 urea amidolyase [Halocynthiibacter sp. C4]